MAFGAPAQHAAGQIGDILEAVLLQDDRGLRRAAAGAAHRDDRALALVGVTVVLAFVALWSAELVSRRRSGRTAA